MLIKSFKGDFDVEVCESFFSKIRGLMFRPLPKEGLLFVFKKEDWVNLHMMYVFYTIDIVFINANFKVVKVLNKVYPFVPFVLGCKCKYVLEVKDSKSLEVGDVVKFK